MSLQKITASPEYNIEYPAPRMYIEHIGHSKIDRDTFRIKIQFDKVKLQNDANSLNDVISNMTKICKEAAELSDPIECT